ncbi:MAG: hypothetical protein KDJ65_34545 [Anaerolineae bacterium]|nr:hypothetical protein [Anaerolineae bacterium]
MIGLKACGYPPSLFKKAAGRGDGNVNGWFVCDRIRNDVGSPHWGRDVGWSTEGHGPRPGARQSEWNGAVPTTQRADCRRPYVTCQATTRLLGRMTAVQRPSPRG